MSNPLGFIRNKFNTGVMAVTSAALSVLPFAAHAQQPAAPQELAAATIISSSEDLKKWEAPDARAQELSLQEKILAIGFYWGEDNKRDGKDIGEDMVNGFASLGVPAKCEINIVPGKGALFVFFIDGNSYSPVIDHKLKSRFSYAEFIDPQQKHISKIAAKFSETFPGVTAKRDIRTASLENN